MYKSVSAVFLCVFVCSVSVFAFNGDMGLSTEPLTDGSVDYPWLIEDELDFEAFRGKYYDLPQPGGGTVSKDMWAGDSHVKLMADLDLSGTTYTKAPLCYYNNTLEHFYGKLDGNDHTISGLKIDGRSYDDGRLGLFASNHGGQIRNLHVSVYIQGPTGFGDGYYVGGICGYNNNGLIENCSSSGTITGNMYQGGLCGYNTGTIRNCSSSAFVMGERRYIGGLCGDNYSGLITRCSSSGYVCTNGDGEVGGLCGANKYYASITECSSSATVYGESSDNGTGGLCGASSGPISNCYASGDVTGDEKVGGLVGDLNRTLVNCHAAAQVVGNVYNGGLVGRAYQYEEGMFTNCYWSSDYALISNGVGNLLPDPTGVTELSSADMQVQGNFSGWDFIGNDVDGTDDIWWLQPGVYPVLVPEQCPYALAGDLNQDCTITFEDVVIIAGNWLLDCYENPGDPACVYND